MAKTVKAGTHCLVEVPTGSSSSRSFILYNLKQILFNDYRKHVIVNECTTDTVIMMGDFSLS